MAMRRDTIGRQASRSTIHAALGILAAAALVSGWRQFAQVVVNPVNYDCITVHASPGTAWYLGPALVVAAGLMLMVRRAATDAPRQAATESARWTILLPLAAIIGIGGCWALGIGINFLTLCALIAAVGWALTEMPPNDQPAPLKLERLAPILLVCAILASTAWHALMQVAFWRHLMLGYADFGFFTTELEHCLPWNDVAHRFADTRMGYHCIPFFYLLAPGYALFRSPVFLMVVGPLALNLAALAFFDLARRRTGSPLVGLLVALAWLALPSLSRLPYANTYGFQSVYLAVPWLAYTFNFGLTGRWRSAHVCLVVALLCEETICGVAVGWGTYLLLFGGRRRDGLVILAASLAYLLLTTQWIIPHFATAQTYTRMHLFGSMSPGDVMDRILRPRAGRYVLVLAAPLLVGLVRAPRLLLLAAPTLLLVLMMQNEDWLNIKYWHQGAILPALFAAAVWGLTRQTVPGTMVNRVAHDGGEHSPGDGSAAINDSAGGGAHGPIAHGPIAHGRDAPGDGTPRANLRPKAWSGTFGLLAAVVLFHQALGYSPISRAGTLQTASGFLAKADPRMAVIGRIRNTIPRDRTILATERVAAHFTDYRAVYTGRAPQPTDVVVVDRADQWDTSGLVDRVTELAASGAYTVTLTEHGLVVLEKTRNYH